MAIERALVKVVITNKDEGIQISTEHTGLSNYRLILYSMKGADFPILQHQTQVDIVAYYEDGIKVMWGEVSLSLPGQINVEVLSSAGEKQERRSNLKVRTTFDAKVLTMRSIGKRRLRMKVNSNIRVRDLSLGGMGFFSEKMFFRNQYLVVELSHLKPGLLVDFQVLRREKILDHGDYSPRFKYRYGGRVMKLSGEEERLICEYVFKVQLTDYQRRKEKNAL